jgi:hypothetical protein
MVLDQKYPLEKGKLMITRRQYRTLLTTPGGEVNVQGEQQAIPIYDAIAQALRDGDVLRITHNDFAYETDVLWLLHHLPATANRHDVEALLQERFGQKQVSNQFDPEDVLRIQALAEDIWHAWSQYLQRHDQSAFAQARSRARGLMGRYYYPRTNSRSGLAS